MTQAALVLVGVFVAAQFVRPDRSNPTTDPVRTIQAHAGTTSELTAVLDRSCRDCHSNNTVWPWYTQIAPVSCEDATSGKMPRPYTLVRPETRLSLRDVETICAAARLAQTNAAD